MNDKLEARLTQHLGSADLIDHEPSQLAGVHRLARRRAMRNRVATGAMALAALAGIASLVPTNDDSNALITATEPTATPQMIVEEVEPPTTTPEPSIDQTDAQTDDSEFVDPPVFLNLVGDGLGGFVGVDTFGQQTIQFLRSDDGENWRLAETLALPDDSRFETFTFADGLFIAQLEQPDPTTGEFGLLGNPLLAVSSDLQSWDYVEVEIGRSESADGEPLQAVKYNIDNFVRNGDQLAMLVRTVSDFDPGLYGLALSDLCGQIDRPSGVTLVLCDGTTQQLPPGHVARVALRPETRAFVSTAGAVATPLDLDIAPLTAFEDLGSSHALLADGDSFRLMTPGDDITELLPAELQTDDRAATFVSAQLGFDGNTLLIARAGDELVPLRVTNDGASLDSALGSFPSAVASSPASVISTTHVAHGPAGWLLALASLEDLIVVNERNGWIFGSSAGGVGGVARSTSADETVAYEVNSAGLPPHVHLSLFGGVRYLHPETGELIIELTAAEALIPEPWSEIEDQIGIGRTLVVDGWELRGNPVTGPLTLTSPNGEIREFTDGFAFDNDDITDGVETDFNNRSFLQATLYGAGAIVFYDDQGNELVTIQGSEIITEFVNPVVDEAELFEALVTDPVAQPEVSVVYSSDGIQWTVLPIDDDDVGPFLPPVAVGDDELLVGLTPQELMRLPLDE